MAQSRSDSQGDVLRNTYSEDLKHCKGKIGLKLDARRVVKSTLLMLRDLVNEDEVSEGITDEFKVSENHDHKLYGVMVKESTRR